MIELPLVFIAGILGTAHCLGMCGPFVLAIGNGAATWWSALFRQLSYTAGRIFTYSVLGAVAGFCGQRLSDWAPTLVNIPAVLAIIAGMLLTVQGLRAAGLWPRRWLRKESSLGATSCLAGGFLAQYLRRPGASGVFLAGVFTGFLPCGLLYGMLALATSTHSVAWGAAVMAVFGMGTAPLLVLAGIGSRLLGLVARRWLLATAAWCLILTGLVSAARGVSFLSVSPDRPATCPFCSQ